VETLRPDSVAARSLAGALRQERFTLVDVGCSGGIHPAWRAFEPRLSALAFDPSLHAVETLKAAEANPEVRYFAGFVGLPDGHPAKGADPEFWRVDPWGRLAAHHTQQRQQAPGPAPEIPPAAAPATDTELQQDLMERNLWRDAELARQDAPIVLPDFLKAQGVADVDFIKIDVDGTDFEILQSLQPVFDGGSVLGAVLEVNFHGSASPAANSFHNVDRFMRQQGFDLLDLTVRRYALDALPFPFLYPHPLASQSVGGRPFQGDALYLRDFGYPHGGQDAAGWSDEKLLKLAALQALFGLYDHAAETLLLFRERLGRLVDVDALLDRLTAEIQGANPDLAPEPGYDGYRDYRAAYEAEATPFYGALQRREAARRRAAETVETMTRCLEALESEAAETKEALEAAVRDLAAVTSSSSWRLTAPIRALLGAMRGR
jgi:hypothetical protein